MDFTITGSMWHRVVEVGSGIAHRLPNFPQSLISIFNRDAAAKIRA